MLSSRSYYHEPSKKFVFDHQVKMLIFDCDGALMNSLHQHFKAFRDAYKNLDKEFVTEEHFMEKLSGSSSPVIIQTVNEQFGYQLNPVDISFLKDQIFVQKYAHEVQPLQKVLAVAKQYHGILPMFVASGGQAIGINLMLESTGLRYLFQGVVTVENVKCGKPAPDIFLEASKRINIAPSNCFFF